MIVKLRRSRSDLNVPPTRESQKSFPMKNVSGEPQTHPSLAAPGVTSARKVPLIQEERFMCRGGVDAKRLLRTIRASLLEEAHSIGATVLVEEQWHCIIHSPRRSDGVYKVDIRYMASAARSDIMADPQQPVALDKAKGVPGLMTVVA